MKVKLYFGKEDAIKKSGIGRAMVHQKQALDIHNIAYTTDKESLDYDILHINTIWPDSLKAIRQARKHDKKIIYHAHSTEEDFRNSFMFSNLVSGIFKKWLIYLYSKADYILTPTPYSKKLLEGYGIQVPIENISNGVCLEDFAPTKEQEKAFIDAYGIVDTQFLVISVGWLFERKGFDTFVEVAKRFPDYTFMWFGDVKMSNPTNKIRKLINNLPSNVILPGYIEPYILKGAYGRANVFFFPSREETEGIVVLEALSCQSQVVLRDIPVFDEWVVDKVHCYKGKTEEDFVEILKGIYDGALPSTTATGYQVAKERELVQIGEQLKGIYEAVLQQK